MDDKTVEKIRDKDILIGIIRSPVKTFRELKKVESKRRLIYPFIILFLFFLPEFVKRIERGIHQLG